MSAGGRMHYHLLIDADDTLWECNIYFEQAIHDFITFLNHSQLTRQEVRLVQDDMIQLMGYGAANFTRSLLETYRRLAERGVLDEDVRQVQQLGERIRAQPIQLLAGVRETLAYLARRHDLILLTKGDVAEQQRKVEWSGIGDCFREVVIVPEKDAATYRHVAGKLGVDPERAWMVGNSPRSDINPALAAGLNAVYIPHPYTWHLEHAEIQPVRGRRLLTLATFADLRTQF